VVQLYAGAFFPGLMLTGLYILYIILVAKLKPAWAPPLSAADRLVTLPPLTQKLTTDTSVYAFTRLVGALKGSRNVEVPLGHILRQLSIVVLPGLIFLLIAVSSFKAVTTVDAIPVYDIQPIGSYSEPVTNEDSGGLQSPPLNGDELQVPQSSGVQEPPGAEPSIPSSLAASIASAETAMAEEPEAATTRDAPTWWWVCFAILGALVTLFYLFLSFARLEIFKMLLSSFFPLMVLIISVLGSIVMGLATPTEAAAMGALGGFVLAVAYRRLTLRVLQEAVFLTAKTSAMVCWLFVGSAIFSAAFALLGGQNLVEEWVLSMDLSTTQFLIMSQVVIFLLGWSLEWTEIIVIFMPIFIPLLDNFGVDPLFFGLLVALNLQTAFLSPPVAMAAFYLKGVAPKHVTLNQIFLGMLPFMGIQILAIVMLYQFPGIGMWLPEMLYR
jgi:TRAP-type mannitol/chloroaromatic compound transport system permease large subunit